MAGERSVKIRFTGEAKGLVGASSLGERALKRFQDQAEKVGKVAGRVASVTKAMVAPNAAPAVAALAVAGVGAAAALGAAGAAVGVFTKVVGASQTEVTEAATQINTLTDKVGKYEAMAATMAKQGKDNTVVLKQQAAAELEVEAALAGLDPAVRAATQSYLRMQAGVKGFVKANEPTSLGLLQRGYKLIGDNVGRLQPLYDVGAAAAKRALGALERFAAGGGIERLVAFLTKNAGPAIDNLARIGKNVATFFAALFQGTVSDGQGLLKFLADASDKLASFATGGGLQQLLDRIREQGPGAGQALVQIGSAALAVAQAVGPLAPISLAIAQALAAIIAAVPPGVITALVGAWIAYTVALGTYNTVMAITAGATKVWAAAQTALNVVMALNPITLIVIAIVALIAIIVLIATKTTWFQDIWRVVWGAIKSAAAAVGRWFTDTLWPSLKKAFDQLVAVVKFVFGIWKFNFNLMLGIGRALVRGYITYVTTIVSVIRRIIGAVVSVYTGAKAQFDRLVAYIRALPGRIASASSNLFNGIKNSFRNAVNYIIDGWNRLSFSLPSINTPFGKIGGTTLNTPNIPRLASGGWMQPGRTYLTGENGPELLTSSRRAYVNNAGDTAAMASAPSEVHVYIGDRELTDIVDVRVQHGNRQTRRALGARLVGA